MVPPLPLIFLLMIVEHLTVTESFWTIHPVEGVEPTDLSKNPGYSGRVEYFTDEQKHFSLKLSDVMKKDEHQYCFRIKTNVEKERWSGFPGVQLRVPEIHVETSEKVTEGETADLTCKTTCSLIDPTFIWYKNGCLLTTKTIKNNQLHLQTVSSEDAGSYSCAVRGYQHFQSTAHNLRVRYPPKSVSVSSRPSSEIVEGSSVTLTCSSDANPPIYTWFKGSTSIGEGKTYRIPNIRSEDSGEYTCQSWNDHGERRSTAVQLNVLYPPKNVSVSISPSGEIVEGSSVTMTCSSDANPPVKIYTWFKEGGTSPVGSGHSYSPLQSGSYYCKAQNQHGAQNATAVSVIVQAPPLRVSRPSDPHSTNKVFEVCGLKSRPVHHPSLPKSPRVPASEQKAHSVLSQGHVPLPSGLPHDMEMLAGLLALIESRDEGDFIRVCLVEDCHIPVKSLKTHLNITALDGSPVEAVAITCFNAMVSLRVSLPLLFLLMIVGAFGTEWSVKFNQQEICALKGSTVFMNGTYTHPENLTVTETFWTLDPDKKPDLSKDPDYSGRVEYFTDEQKHFSLKLSDVMKKDEHQFCFRIKTNVEKQRWVGTPGVQLRVTDLHVETPEEVTEGETTDVTCKTTCSLTDPTFIWYKNGRPLTTKTIKNNQLHLQTVSSEDAGSYSCAILQRMSISPSGEIVEGSSVTLTCSSDANPPVKIYTWFKGSTSAGKGKTYSIPNITFEDSGEYTCQSRNDHGERNSTAVHLNVLYPPKSVLVSISPSGGITEGSSVTLTCSSDANPSVRNYTWFKEGGTSPVGSGQNYTIISITADHTGLYYCEAQNDHGAQRSAGVPVSLKGYPVILCVAVGVLSEKQRPPPVNSQTAERDSRTSDDVKPQGHLK
ncbi:titin-like [Colossoma macropomum]|uniref:titin-like n=1 Tax=Colossoma macropomum TaxID=42526 RepID=UPI0018652105|nr:titin-like [Colossoma macropomum]